MFLPRSRSRLHRWLLSDQIKPASTSTVHTLKQAIKDTILRHIKIILHYSDGTWRPWVVLPLLCPPPGFVTLLLFISGLHSGQRHSGLEADKRRSLEQTASVWACAFVWESGVMRREAGAVYCLDFSPAELWLWLQTVTHWRGFAKPASWESPPPSPLPPFNCLLIALISVSVSSSIVSQSLQLSQTLLRI